MKALQTISNDSRKALFRFVLENGRQALNRISPGVFVLWLSLFLSSTGMADLPKGSWSISGEIVDLGVSSRGPIFTNTFSLAGHYDNGRFLLDVTPIKTLDDVAESAGWDGNLFCLIQRWPNIPNKNLLRTNCLAYVEPSVFSRYATPALQSALIAIADSNMLSNLERGLLPVILTPQRIYPEENNSHVIKHLSSNYVEIEAFSPGLELGKTGLIPIQGLERGFTRWTHRSKFTVIDTTNMLLLVEYNRFSPIGGKLVQNRAVTAQFTFRPENQERFIFRPVIAEKKLTVLDYSSRYELSPWTKGMADWCCQYEFTNQTWNFDTNFINAQVAQIKTNLMANNGFPKEWLARANTLAAYQHSSTLESHRVITLCFLIGFSVLSAGIFCFGSQRIKTEWQKKN